MISGFFIDRPRFAFVISIVLTLAGLVALFTLPVAQYPDITPGQVTITTSYPGADAKTVQETVIQPIETQVNGVKKLLYLTSTATDTGTAFLALSSNFSTFNGNIRTVRADTTTNACATGSAGSRHFPAENRDISTTVPRTTTDTCSTGSAISFNDRCAMDLNNTTREKK